MGILGEIYFWENFYKISVSGNFDINVVKDSGKC